MDELIFSPATRICIVRKEVWSYRESAHCQRDKHDQHPDHALVQCEKGFPGSNLLIGF
jgi:hypothetical protein